MLKEGWQWCRNGEQTRRGRRDVEHVNAKSGHVMRAIKEKSNTAVHKKLSTIQRNDDY